MHQTNTPKTYKLIMPVPLILQDIFEVYVLSDAERHSYTAENNQGGVAAYWGRSGI